jgi:diaminopimelate decarboxylase
MRELNPTIWPRTARFIDGALNIGGCDVRALARDFGTPLFILDEVDFRERALEWKNSLEKSFASSAGTVYFAAKAFISTEIVYKLRDYGLGIDVCTGGELAVAKAANFPGKLIEMHGNNKSVEEIRDAIEYGVGTIVIDSLQEIVRVSRVAAEQGVIQSVLLRLTPGVEAHTHESIATAHEDVKFGFSIASGAAWDAILETRKHRSLKLSGLHAHIGSQIFVSDGFDTSAQRLIEVLGRYRDAFGEELPELDLGGGYGIAYVEGDDPISSQEMINQLAEIVIRECAIRKLSIPKISIEPGRAIIGPSMATLYKIGTTKEVVLDGLTRWYLSVDGGMSDNIRSALYDAKYSALVVNRRSDSPERLSRLVGKHCETGDILIKDLQLPADTVPGDLIAVAATGAYGRSMASNYNHILRPPVISVSDGAARTIVRRELLADLLALDVVEDAVAVAPYIPNSTEESYE